MNELLIKYRYFKDLSDEESAMASAEWQAMNLKYPIELATVSDYVDHIDHIVKTIGIDHVGIGSDLTVVEDWQIVLMSANSQK